MKSTFLIHRIHQSESRNYENIFVNYEDYEINELQSDTGLLSGTSKTCTYSAGNLALGSQYVFQVKAENECGVGPAVEIHTPVTAKHPFSECDPTSLIPVFFENQSCFGSTLQGCGILLYS